MLKQTVQYVDFDDNEQEEILYFNLTKSELTDNLYLQDRLTELRDAFAGGKRALTDEEVRKVVDLVKTFMRLSYGVRSPDRKRFIKTETLWAEFTQTAAYDAFLYGLFEQPDRALAFMTGILPKDLREKATEGAKAEMAKAQEVTTNPAIEAKEPVMTGVPANEVEAYEAWKKANNVK